jgi:hypothetical protein
METARCPAIGMIKKIEFLYTMEYYSAIKRMKLQISR